VPSDQWKTGTMKMVSGSGTSRYSSLNNTGERTISLPIRVICLGNTKHEIAGTSVRRNHRGFCFRHHERHSASFRHWKFFLRDRGSDVFTNLCFGWSDQCQPRSIHCVGKNCPHRSWVITNRTPHPRIPKLRTIKWRHPRAFNQTRGSILPFDCGLVATFLKDENRCMA
jgi:hypothetical protein